MSGSKLFHWRGRRRHPHRHKGRGGRERYEDGGTSFRYTNWLSPKGRQGLVLLIPHPSIHVFVKLCCHFCKKRTLVNIYPSKHQGGNTDEPNTYSFFLQFLWYAARRGVGPNPSNRTQESADLQDRPNFQPSWCILSLFKHDPGTCFWV